MKITIKLDPGDGKGIKTYVMEPSLFLADFLHGLSEDYYGQARQTSDEVKRLIDEGSLDAAVTIANKMKRLNDFGAAFAVASEQVEPVT